MLKNPNTFVFHIEHNDEKYTFHPHINKDGKPQVTIPLTDGSEITIVHNTDDDMKDYQKFFTAHWDTDFDRYAKDWSDYEKNKLCGTVSLDLASIGEYVSNILTKCEDVFEINSRIDAVVEKDTMITLSTAHIEPEVLEMLERDAVGESVSNIEDVVSAFRKIVSGHSIGYFVVLTQSTPVFPSNFPPSLKDCIMFASTYDARWIMFDRDAEAIPQLPVYQQF